MRVSSDFKFMKSAREVISMNNFNSSYLIKEYPINNVISLDVFDNSQLYSYYNCRIQNPTIQLSTVGSRLPLNTSKIVFYDNSIYSLNEDGYLTQFTFQESGKFLPIASVKVPHINNENTLSTLIYYFKWNLHSQKLLLLVNDTLNIFTNANSKNLIQLENSATLTMEANKKKLILEILFDKNDNLLVFYNLTYGVEYYTLSTSNTYELSENLAKIGYIADVVITNTSDEIFILTADTILLIQIDDFSKYNPIVIWKGTGGRYIAKSKNSSTLFMYQESNDESQVRLTKITSHMGEYVFRTLVDCEPGAKGLHVSENEIILGFENMLKIYKNVDGIPLLGTELPISNEINNVFIDSYSDKTTNIVQYNDRKYVYKNGFEFTKAELTCKKKPEAKISSFGFEIRVEICPCSVDSRMKANFTDMLDCCYIYQPFFVEYVNDLAARTGIGFLFGLFLGAGSIFAIQIFSIFWVKQHPDSCMIMEHPPVEESLPLTAAVKGDHVLNETDSERNHTSSATSSPENREKLAFEIQQYI